MLYVLRAWGRHGRRSRVLRFASGDRRDRGATVSSPIALAGAGLMHLGFFRMGRRSKIRASSKLFPAPRRCVIKTTRSDVSRDQPHPSRRFPFAVAFRRHLAPPSEHPLARLELACSLLAVTRDLDELKVVSIWRRRHGCTASKRSRARGPPVHRLPRRRARLPITTPFLMRVASFINTTDPRPEGAGETTVMRALPRGLATPKQE